MILTGKCREDFEIFIECQTQIISMYYFREMPESCKNALIIDFFIYRQIWSRPFYEEYRKTAFMDYEYATNQTIIRCNEIYNHLNKD